MCACRRGASSSTALPCRFAQGRAFSAAGIRHITRRGSRGRRTCTAGITSATMRGSTRIPPFRARRASSPRCRETGYDADFTGSFSCSEPLVNTLVEKAARTLYVCMRDNFMDCPDRERGQWIGDVSMQTPQAAFLLDERAMLLVRKAVRDFIGLRRGDVLVGNVPGEHASELPCQSLAALSEWGMLASYWKYTGDAGTLRLAFRPAVRYLALWELGENGLVVLARVCPKERYPDVRRVLVSVMNSSIYMEHFVLTALCEMGCCADALRRMLSRYYPLAVNENSTLWEDFSILGTKNHAWSGAPAAIAFRYFMGVDLDAPSGQFSVTPCRGLFREMECRFRFLGKTYLARAEGDSYTVAPLSDPQANQKM